MLDENVFNKTAIANSVIDKLKDKFQVFNLELGTKRICFSFSNFLSLPVEISFPTYVL